MIALFMLRPIVSRSSMTSIRSSSMCLCPCHIQRHLGDLEQADGVHWSFGGVLKRGTIHAVVTNDHLVDFQALVQEPYHFCQCFTRCPFRSGASAVSPDPAQ